MLSAKECKLRSSRERNNTEKEQQDQNEGSGLRYRNQTDIAMYCVPDGESIYLPYRHDNGSMHVLRGKGARSTSKDVSIMFHGLLLVYRTLCSV